MDMRRCAVTKYSVHELNLSIVHVHTLWIHKVNLSWLIKGDVLILGVVCFFCTCLYMYSIHVCVCVHVHVHVCVCVCVHVHVVETMGSGLINRIQGVDPS